jgi:hypothetical protein
MDVHPPDHPVITWKQFFVHMAIVVLGLLIAIGLEQSVEWLYRRHQREQLADALERDLVQTQHDSHDLYLFAITRAYRLQSVIGQLQRVLLQGTTE